MAATILDQLVDVERVMRTELDDGTAVGQVALQSLIAGGKRLRPLLVLLACQSAGGSVDEKCTRIAAGAELIHTGSLVHDDIMDCAQYRRGQRSVFAVHGSAGAIVVGDYLAVKGYNLIAAAKDGEVLRLVERACVGAAEGQFSEQVNKTLRSNPDRYFYVVERKTAAIIAACSEIGAHLAGLRGPERLAYQRYGFNLGIAYQLADDVLDVVGTLERVGKDVGLDSQNGVHTGPIVFLMEQDHVRLGGLLRSTIENEGVALTKQAAWKYVEIARQAASTFPENEHTKALRDVIDVLVERKA